MTRPVPEHALRECPDCKGKGLVADYVGLEMKCIGVECDTCKGTGEIRRAEPAPSREGEK